MEGIKARFVRTMTLNEESWKSQIICALRDRDRLQKQSFEGIVKDYSLLKDQVFNLSVECARLEHERDLVKKESSDLKLKLESTNAQKSLDFEKKVFHLQEEVTELHREKGTLAGSVIELNLILQEKEKASQLKDKRITELETSLADTKKLNAQLHEKVTNLENVKQVLIDEQTSNALTIRALETKLRHLEDDNSQLIRRLKVLQDTVEKLKNIEYDVHYRKTQETIRRNLQEAASSVIDVPETGLCEMPLLSKATVPRRSIARIDANEGEVNSVKFTPSGHLFGSAGFDRKLRLWAVVNGKCELHSTLIGCNAAVTAIDFDPNETAVLGASSDFSCRVWTLNDSRLRVTLTGHSDRVVSAKFIGSPNSAVTVSSDRTIKLWDVDKCRCKRTIMAPSTLQDVVVCPSISAIITGHYDHKLRVWDERSAENTNTIQLSGRITGLDVSPDQNSIVACTRNNTLEIVNCRMNQVTKCLTNENFFVGLDIVKPCFSPDTEYVAVGGQDGGVYIWNTVTSQLEICLREHGNVVVCCHWNPVGHSLVSCERIKEAIVWSNV